MFPTITTLEEFQSQIGDMPEIRFDTNADGFTIVCYMIAAAETFSGKNAIWARECRGITFGPDGRLVSRPFHKFFNIGEREETQLHNLDISRVSRVMDKRDGSMVHPIHVPARGGSGIIFKTKKSFDSGVAIAATKVLHEEKFAEHLEFCQLCTRLGITPIFEFTSPKAQIVLYYEETDLQLLHIRDNLTGHYFRNVHEFVEGLGFKSIKIVDEVKINPPTVESLVAGLETETEIEGYVFQFDDGQMVKGKTAWYLELHHTITFVRERDIAEMVLNETLDDYRSYLAISGRSKEHFDEIDRIEHEVLTGIREIEDEIDAGVREAAQYSTLKEIAIAMKGHKMFSAIMSHYRHSEFDVKEYFKKHLLKERFDLQQLP